MNERDEFLRRLLLGELDRDSEEARRLFVDHPDALDDFEDARSLEEAIGHVADERGKLVEGAIHGESVPGEDVAARFLSEQLAATTPSKPGRSAIWIVPLLAAAALALLFWRPWTAPADTREVPDRGPMLGGPLGVLEPYGNVDDFGVFTWEYALEGAQYFRVVVYDVEDPLAPLVESRDLDEPSWTPPGTELWPDALRWEVHVVEDERSVLIEFATVQRRPR